MATTELAVIGAGAAGVAAAVTAARAGISVTLLDEQPHVGGQYLVATAGWQTVWEQRGHALLSELAGLNIDVLAETLVWSLSRDLQLALYSPRGVEHLQAKTVVVATGARESVVPFPGWTLPGVMTVGAAQLLAKKHGVLPGQRVLLAGSGPLLLPAACWLAARGAQVAGVCEATHLISWVRHARAVWGNWDRLQEGRHYLECLRKARIPYRFGRTAVRALGQDELEAVEVARLDMSGRPIPGTREVITADALCLGFALVPNIELTQLAGCAHHYDPQRGGTVPVVDGHQETDVPGLFAAGETAGIGGAGSALVEGEMAGLAIACRLGRISEAELARRIGPLATTDRRLRRFGTMLNTLFSAPAGLDAIITDDTPICRCEEALAGEIRAAIGQGAVTLDALKNWTRAGQGPCQGRTCGPILARLLARETGQAPAEHSFHVRPPLKPVPLAALAKGERP